MIAPMISLMRGTSASSLPKNPQMRIYRMWSALACRVRVGRRLVGRSIAGDVHGRQFRSNKSLARGIPDVNFSAFGTTDFRSRGRPDDPRVQIHDQACQRALHIDFVHVRHLACSCRELSLAAGRGIEPASPKPFPGSARRHSATQPTVSA